MLNSIDVYGKEISFTIDRTKGKITSQIGGIMTIFLVAITSSFLCTQIIQMFNMERVHFDFGNKLFRSKNMLPNITLENLEDSFELVVGISDD